MSNSPSTTGPILSASGDLTDSAYAFGTKPKTTTRLIGDTSSIPNDKEYDRIVIKRKSSTSTDNLIELQEYDGTVNSSFSESGFLKYTNTTAWEGINITTSMLKEGAVDDPTFAKIKDDGTSSHGVFAYLFASGADNELFFTTQIPHSYKEGTDISANVHWEPTSAASGNYVVWGLEYTWSNTNDIIQNTTTIVASGETNGEDRHQKTELGTISGTNKTISSIISGRIYRNGVIDYYDSSAALLGIELNYRVDSLGSEEETDKF